MLFIYLYWLASLVVIISSFSNAGLGPGLSALATSALSFFAGGGLRGSLYGTKGQKIAGSLTALVCMSIAYYIGAGFSVRLYDHLLTGTQWGWIGFFICLIFTPRSMTYISAPKAA